MPSKGFRDRTQINRKRMNDRSWKEPCKVCGRSVDIYHDAAKCAGVWLAKVDAEKASEKEGATT